MRTSSGISLDPRGINDEFNRFYQSLYTSESKVDTLELDFFHLLAVPSPDGYSAEFYKKFISKITPILI